MMRGYESNNMMWVIDVAKGREVVQDRTDLVRSGRSVFDNFQIEREWRGRRDT